MQVLLDEYNEFVKENFRVIHHFEKNLVTKKTLALDMKRAKEIKDPEESSRQISEIKKKAWRIVKYEKRNLDIIREYQRILTQVNSMGLEAVKHFAAPELEAVTEKTRYYIVGPRKVLIKVLENPMLPASSCWSWHFHRRLWTIQTFSDGSTSFYQDDFKTREEACQEIARMIEAEKAGEAIEVAEKDVERGVGKVEIETLYDLIKENKEKDNA